MDGNLNDLNIKYIETEGRLVDTQGILIYLKAQINIYRAIIASLNPEQKDRAVLNVYSAITQKGLKQNRLISFRDFIVGKFKSVEAIIPLKTFITDGPIDIQHPWVDLFFSISLYNGDEKLDEEDRHSFSDNSIISLNSSGKALWSIFNSLSGEVDESIEQLYPDYIALESLLEQSSAE